MDRHNWLASFAMACVVLSAGMAMGHAFAMWIDTLPVGRLTQADLVPTTARADDPSGWELFAFILRNNLAVYVLLLFGLVSAGAVTFVILLGNGIALGQVVGLARLSGMSNTTLVELLLPHAVLELGALCIAGAVGFQGFRLALGLLTVEAPHSRPGTSLRCVPGSPLAQPHRPRMDQPRPIACAPGRGCSMRGVSLRSLRLGLVLGFGVCALTTAAGVEAFVTAEFAE